MHEHKYLAIYSMQRAGFMKTYSAFPVIVPHLIFLPQILIKRTKKIRKHFLGFIVVLLKYVILEYLSFTKWAYEISKSLDFRADFC
jgi:hypothetical protein